MPVFGVDGSSTRGFPMRSVVCSPTAPELAMSMAGEPALSWKLAPAGFCHQTGFWNPGLACFPFGSCPEAAAWKADSVSYVLLPQVTRWMPLPEASSQITSRSSVVPVCDVLSTRRSPLVAGHVVVPPAPSGQFIALSTLMLFSMVTPLLVPAGRPSRLIPADVLPYTVLPVIWLPVTSRSSMPWSPVKQSAVLPVEGWTQLVSCVLVMPMLS